MPSLVRMNGLISASEASSASLAFASAIIAAAALFATVPGMPIPNASLRAWNGCSPMPGSIASFRIRSGVFAATSSISMPPSADAMNVFLPVARSSTMPRYSSRSMGSVSSISSRCTTRPSGPVWCVTSVMPRIFSAIAPRFRGVLGHLDAAAFAAPSGVNLRLHDDAAADLLRRSFRLVNRIGDLAARHRYGVFRQESLGLIFVNFHWDLVEPTKLHYNICLCRSAGFLEPRVF